VSAISAPERMDRVGTGTRPSRDQKTQRVVEIAF
jgi:hypothetical protein